MDLKATLTWALDRCYSTGNADSLEELLDELMPQIGGEWISVKDRLPEVKKDVDLRDNWYIGRTINNHTIPLSWNDYNGEPCWHGYGGNSGCFRSDEIITHWQSLPPPPGDKP